MLVAGDTFATEWSISSYWARGCLIDLTELEGREDEVNSVMGPCRGSREHRPVGVVVAYPGRS
jgi:hypothetical protein